LIKVKEKDEKTEKKKTSTFRKLRSSNWPVFLELMMVENGDLFECKRLSLCVTKLNITCWFS